MQYRTIRAAPPNPADAAESAAEDLFLDDEEVRVLGSLVEKEATTPDYYPLTLLAVLSACNQRSSRDPVVSYDEDTVTRTLERLQSKGLAHRISSSAAGRVPRYRHLFHDVFGVNRPQGALLCVLMLRGAQTAGELRQRASRVYEFHSLEEVEQSLAELAEKTRRPLVAKLPRQPGSREPRFIHLLSADQPPASLQDSGNVSAEPALESRLMEMEQRITRLEDQIRELTELLR